MSAPLPMKCEDLKPLLDWGAARPFAGIAKYLKPAYVCEPKFDGVRCTLLMRDKGNRLATQRVVFSANFPQFTQAVMPGIEGTLLDAELVADDPATGMPRLGVASGLAMSNASRAVRQQRFGSLARLYVFDVLSIGGGPILGLPYEQRSILLTQIVTAIRRQYPRCEIHRVPQLPATAKTITRLIADGYEGVVLKRKTSTYVPGTRDNGWYKVKATSTADAFITGWRPGEGGNTRLVGSVELSLMFADGPIPIGHVGNFTDRFRRAISEPDGSLDPAMYGKVVEFTGQLLSRDGKIRHPLMVRMRPDKTPADCQAVEQLEAFPRA